VIFKGIVTGAKPNVVVVGLHVHVPHVRPPLGGLYAQYLPAGQPLPVQEDGVKAGNPLHMREGMSVVVVTVKDLHVQEPGNIGLMLGMYTHVFPTGQLLAAH
jgi:hypothetical protein